MKQKKTKSPRANISEKTQRNKCNREEEKGQPPTQCWPWTTIEHRLESSLSNPSSNSNINPRFFFSINLNYFCLKLFRRMIYLVQIFLEFGRIWPFEKDLAFSQKFSSCKNIPPQSWWDCFETQDPNPVNILFSSLRKKRGRTLHASDSYGHGDYNLLGF